MIMFHLVRKLILLVVIIGAILFFYFNIKNASDLQKAIDQAKTFVPSSGKLCTQTITVAIHTETGAKYTFPSGCLPEGWKVTTN